LFSFFPVVAQPNQINPGTQIRWPIGCQAGPSAGGVYVPATNQCIPTGTGANAAGQAWDLQLNAGGTNFGVSNPRIYGDANGNLIGNAAIRFPQPRVDIQAPLFSIGGGIAGLPACPNAIDPTGVTDSLCPMQNAANYIPAVYGSAIKGAYPCLYISPGRYKINGTLRVPRSTQICGDGMDTATIVEANPAVSAIVIYSSTAGSGASWPPLAAMTGLSIQCGVQGNPGNSSYAGCTGNAIQVQTTNYSIWNVQINNWGGYGYNMATTSEEIRLKNIWCGDVRWCVPNIGQATDSLDDLYAAGPGQDDSGFCFSGGNCTAQGLTFSHNWAPTSVTLQSAAVDNAGNATITVTCAPAACLSQGYINGNAVAQGFSSPVPPGGLFRLSGITDPNLTMLNGVWQAQTVTGTPTNPFTITFTVWTGGQWTYGPNNFQMIYFCGNNVTCNKATTTSYSATTPAGMFQPTAIRSPNYAVNSNGPTNVLRNLRVNPLYYANAYQSFGLEHLDGLYAECQSNAFPCQQNSLTVGLANSPYTLLTSTAPTTTGVSTVVASSWFRNYTTDPSQSTDITAMLATLQAFPCDYNPTQTGVPSACNPTVNTNQTEVFNGTFSTDGLHYITRKLGGSTVTTAAGTGPAWGPGTIITYQVVGMALGSNGGEYNKLRASSDLILGGGGAYDYTSQCNDQGPSPCGQILIGTFYNPIYFWPGTVQGGGHILIMQQDTQTTNAQPPNPATGVSCIKVFDKSHVSLVESGGGIDVVSNNYMQTGESPAVANGTVTHGMSHCVIVPQYQNQLAGNVWQTQSPLIHDTFTNSFLSCAGGNVGNCRFKSDVVVPSPNGAASLGGSSTGGYALPYGHTFTNAEDQMDTAGYTATGTITSWSWNQGSGLATFQSTMNPGLGNYVFISGLVQGSFLNNFGTPQYDNGWSVQSSTASQFVVWFNGSGYGIPLGTPTSATEGGNVTMYKPIMRTHVQGGPNNTGANVGWDFQLYNGSAWQNGVSMHATAANPSNLNFASNGHINQTATKNWAGNCTMASGTCGAQTFNVPYSQTPACVCSWTGGGTLTGLIKCVASTASVTPQSSVGTDSAAVAWSCTGNPN